ncbi:MAG: hypothetical protein JRI58_13600 [Deltaproteobacteria bacterium]|nr:hypothetical protein [Deltaproteobacteria bacterium]MBW2075753.1 hypothetical protein [Deltaproteobacteria bacterium]
MQVEGLEKLITGIVMLVVGLGIVIKSKSIAKACRDNKVKVFGEAKHDDTSEFIAKGGVILIGIVGILGGFLKIYQYLR